MDFNDAFERLIGHEGGFTDDPNDDGNWTGGKQGVGELKGTKFGIAANSYPDLDIKNLTVEDARLIYYQDYWLKVGNDLFELPDFVEYQLFDIAVNQGVKAGIKRLQELVGFEGENVDGVMGPKTVAAAKAMGHDPEAERKFTGRIIKSYTGMKRWPEFGKGWMNRLAANLLKDFDGNES